MFNNEHTLYLRLLDPPMDVRSIKFTRCYSETGLNFRVISLNFGAPYRVVVGLPQDRFELHVLPQNVVEIYTMMQGESATNTSQKIARIIQHINC